MALYANDVTVYAWTGPDFLREFQDTLQLATDTEWIRKMLRAVVLATEV